VILLDTNVVSAVMLQRPDPEVVAWLDRINPRQVWLPSVVVFELRYGAGPSSIDHRNDPGAHCTARCPRC